MSEGRRDGYTVFNIEKTLDGIHQMAQEDAVTALSYCILELVRRTNEQRDNERDTRRCIETLVRSTSREPEPVLHFSEVGVDSDKVRESFNTSVEKKSREVLRNERDEWKKRALAAEEKIEDARGEVTRWCARVSDLEARLEGALKALERRPK